jgi:hypothetical protein
LANLQTRPPVLVSICFRNQSVQLSTKQGNPRAAQQIEAAHKTRDEMEVEG